MGKLLHINDKPLKIICERCYTEIGQGYTYGYMFYCDECMKVLERAQAVKDFDNVE